MTMLNTLFLVSCLAVCAADEVGHGWGDDIAWTTFDDAAALASSSGKPIMLVIHKTWCGACKALKPKFAGSVDIRELSSSFVMVNVEDDEEPKGDMYTPDGGYIPRILFLNKDAKVVDSIKNPNGNPKYGYYYSDADQVAEGMKAAIESLGGATEEL